VVRPSRRFGASSSVVAAAVAAAADFRNAWPRTHLITDHQSPAFAALRRGGLITQFEQDLLCSNF
jgi:hypothetical protein